MRTKRIDICICSLCIPMLHDNESIIKTNHDLLVHVFLHLLTCRELVPLSASHQLLRLLKWLFNAYKFKSYVLSKLFLLTFRTKVFCFVNSTESH